ncbi:MAG: S26 family signal peptidase, partial [Lentisphaeria bacterium]|nr:S26 family signal peptidase [Lentisphaeria bacterium]
MAFGWCIIIDIALIWFFFGNWILEHVLPKNLLLKRQLRGAAKILANRLKRDGDIMTNRQNAEISDFRNKLIAACSDTSIENRENLLKHFKEDFKLPAFKHYGTLGANLEMLVVSIGVAFAIRSLVINPFKIPTGSMQPTLFGIHQVELQDDSIPSSKFATAFDYINYSRRYFKIQAPADGQIDFMGIQAAPSKPFFPNSVVPFQTNHGTTYLKTPAALNDTQKLFYELYTKRLPEYGQKAFDFKQGETITQGAMESGDHLFVNRLSLCFNEPKRGDIMVFSTTGLSYKGQDLAGVFYVKRLVGLPGDTLKIVDRVLYVKPEGADDFIPLDGTYSRPFGRIQSRQGGYAGHSVQPSGIYLTRDAAEFTVPAEM